MIKVVLLSLVCWCLAAAVHGQRTTTYDPATLTVAQAKRFNIKSIVQRSETYGNDSLTSAQLMSRQEFDTAGRTVVNIVQYDPNNKPMRWTTSTLDSAGRIAEVHNYTVIYDYNHIHPKYRPNTQLPDTSHTITRYAYQPEQYQTTVAQYTADSVLQSVHTSRYDSLGQLSYTRTSQHVNGQYVADGWHTETDSAKAAKMSSQRLKYKPTLLFSDRLVLGLFIIRWRIPVTTFSEAEQDTASGTHSYVNMIKPLRPWHRKKKWCGGTRTVSNNHGRTLRYERLDCDRNVVSATISELTYADNGLLKSVRSNDGTDGHTIITFEYEYHD